MLKRVNFFEGDVEHIDLPNKNVLVSHGDQHHHHTLEYDHLVIGLGSITNFLNLPGLQSAPALSHSESELQTLESKTADSAEACVIPAQEREALAKAQRPQSF